MTDAGFQLTGTPSAVGGQDDRPAVMLVHGMWSRPPVWDNFRAYFEDRGYRVIVPTLRHHTIEPGDTPHPELGTTSLADYVSDIVIEIGRLRRKPLIIGHSMGGLIAQMLAARNLARAAVCLASAHCAGYVTFDRGPILLFRDHVVSGRFWRKAHLPSFDAMRVGALNGMPPARQEEIYATLIPESGRAFFEIGYWFFDRRRTTWINPDHIACPMLMLTGMEDRLTPLDFTRRMAEGYGERARLEALKGHAHWLPSEPGWERIAERAAAFFEHEAPALAPRFPVPAAAGDLVPAL